MEQVWLRNTQPEDSERMLQWLKDTKNNLFDPSVMMYPRTELLCAFSKRHPIVYIPIQTTCTLESLAINPEASPLEVAAALKEIVKGAALLCRRSGIGEMYFLCKDDATIEFAKRHEFEELPWKTFRMRLQ